MPLLMEYTTLIALAAILLLVVLSAFFSGSETALTAASRPRMHQMSVKGSRRASIVNGLRERQDRMLGAILLGNNLVNILASALATSVLIGLFGEAGVVYATVSMTLLVLIFGEVIPKTYAFRHADNMALVVAPVINLLVRFLSPFMQIIYWLTGVRKLMGGQGENGHNMQLATEELRGAIALQPGADDGGKQQQIMLHSILDLADVDVGMVMQHRQNVFMIDASLPTGRIVDEALKSPFTRIPLWKDTPDNIIGVMHAKDLLRAVHAHGDSIDDLFLDEICSPPWFVPESTRLRDQLFAFQGRREHFALVVDEYGTFMGVVTLEDILEEIVGDINDEHDATTDGIGEEEGGSHLVPGDVTVRDLNRRFGWTLPDQEAVTIAGLVINKARAIPDAGERFEFPEFRLEVVSRQRNRITLIRVTKLDANAGSDSARD